MRISSSLALVFLALSLSSCGRPPSSGALSPQDSLKAMQLSEDFRVELFAAEPDVVDPVDLAFDEFGRVYVAEMLDYPDDPPAGQPPRSRIRLLEDADGDGKFEKNTIFADQVLQVSGLLPFGGGLLVPSAPDILFMKDTDGDGRADVREVWYTGFPKVNPEGRITNLRYNIDNWIYAANNGANGVITSKINPQHPPVLVRGADFRFDPIRRRAEPASGPTQYGMAIDNWGNRFLTQNTVHVRHAVVPMQYLLRAPLLDAGDVSWNIYKYEAAQAKVYPLTKPQEWREKRTKLRQARYDENKLNRIEQVGGYFTAATGGTIYNGDVFPEEFVGNLFTGEVNGNLIHRDILTPDGVTFRAAPAREGVEFLASTDVWFRPCNFANAPDGLLYFADIYREFIETPESIPEEIKKGMNFYSGDTMGRIYRLVPKQPRRQRSLKTNLGRMPVAELVRELESTNGWNRFTAQRLIVERQDKSAVPHLKELAAKSESPLGRVHALWTLHGLDALEAPLVEAGLRDPHPGVREQAIRMAERFLPALGPALLRLAKDPEIRVRYQLAFTLGELRQGGSLPPPVLDTLADLAAAHREDKWFQKAVLSSVAGSPAQFLPLLLSRRQAALLPQLAALIGARGKPAEIGQLLGALTSAPEPGPALAGLARGLRLNGTRQLSVASAEPLLGRLFAHPDGNVQDAAWDVARYLAMPNLIHAAFREAGDERIAPERRARALRALRGADFAAVRPVVAKVLASPVPAAVQVAAIECLASFEDPAVPAALLANWRAYAPAARTKTIAALLTSQARIDALIEALDRGDIEVAALDIAARARLLETGERARKLLRAQEGDRMKVVDAYRESTTLAGNVERGKVLFEENCARCHMPRREGGRIGPDLSGVNNKSKEELLTSILHPSYAIDPRYTNYIVTTRDGHMYDGVIAHETPAVLTLRGGTEEGDQAILRRNIAEIRASAISLMPEDFEKTISKQGLADILAYLRAGL